MGKNLKLATFGGGCFWCTEAIFQEVIGVEKVVSGYSGGTVPGHPTYREICSGLTGHAEVVQITYDANRISYEEILLIFMSTHDPTTLNRQGADRGTQYRSVIYYHTQKQREVAEEVLKAMSPYYKEAIVTEVSPYKIFYKAEKEHQDYYKNNQEKNYCNLVIVPKLKNLRALFSEKLK